MISVVIATHNSAAGLADSLSALVRAAVDGLVREVVVADAGSTDATLAVADDAGTRVVSGGLAEGCAAARSDWLLLLAPGGRPPPGWEAAAAELIDAGGGAGGFFAGPKKGWLRGAAPSLERGLLMSRALYSQLPPGDPVAGARKLKLRRL